MKGANELVFAEQFGHLVEVAKHRNWGVTQTDKPEFILVLPARDESLFGLHVNCESFPVKPPIWRWCNPKTHITDQPIDTPKGSGYFHSSGRICAPWNRIAYRQVDTQGPHSDWELANWRNNPRATGHTELLEMALRLSIELMSDRYQGRSG